MEVHFLKSKYSDELKVEVLKEYLEGNESISDLGRKYAIDRGTIIKWIGLYRYHGIEGLCNRNGSYDGQFKKDVIEYMYANHLSIRETAAKFGVPDPSIVCSWKRIYYEEGPQAFFKNSRGGKKMDSEKNPVRTKIDKKSEEDLLAENQRLRMEIAYLKKLNALVQERIQRENGKK